MYNNSLYLPSAVFIAQSLEGPSKEPIAQCLEGPSKELKEIIQIEHNIVKNPNQLEANQLVICMYKRGQGFECGATVKQIQVMFRAEL